MPISTRAGGLPTMTLRGVIVARHLTTLNSHRHIIIINMMAP
jgi:hypothetical protein